MAKGISITFFGGTDGPTGSNFLVRDPKEESNILIDCGLTQGCKVCEDLNRADFLYDPKSINFLFVTHAHIDHIGRIPKLVRDGFAGHIISTEATKEISERMLVDSLGVLEKEAKQDGQKAFYEKKDVIKAISLWDTVSYHENIKAGGFSVKALDAGHVLGSSMYEFTCSGVRTVFTGDLGNSPAPFLRDTEKITGAHYLITESVYGDRIHEGREERTHLLEDTIEETIHAGGALMIPAFSLERTQELLYELNSLRENGRIPKVPIFIDSPLAIDITKIYKKHQSQFNVDAKDKIKTGDDIFNFPGLVFTYTTKESKAIAETPNPKIIIAGSGMSNGGRIIHHEKRYLPDPKSTLLIVGYQVPKSMGRQLQDGVKSVNILGTEIPVRAHVRTIRGYSAHKDSEQLLEFISTAADTLKAVYVVLGEPKARLFLVQRIRDYLGIHASAPTTNKEIIIPI
jgi:metallo-beta-lactamase family protein